MTTKSKTTKESEVEEKKRLTDKILLYIRNKDVKANALTISLNELRGSDDKKITEANFSNLKQDKLGLDRLRLISRLLDKLKTEDPIIEAPMSYIYCYLDSDHTTVKAAHIIFDVKSKEWGDGSLKYFDIVDEKEHRYDLKRNNYKDINDTSGVMHYYAIRHDGKKIDFLSINIKQSTIAQRKIVFLTDSVLEFNTLEPSCGYGILIAEDDIDTIERYKKAIPDWINNTLRYKKITLSKDLHPPFESIDKFLERNKQFKNTIIISGYYEGFFIHLKDDFDDITNSKYYRIILSIEDTGAVYLYDKVGVRKRKVKEYKSRLTFPIKDREEKYLKVNIEINEHTFVSRLDLWLQAIDGKLEGIIIGFPSTKNEILISPILFNPIEPLQVEGQGHLSDEEIAKKMSLALEAYNLGRIAKSELSQKKDLDNKLKNIFIELNEKYINKLNIE